MSRKPTNREGDTRIRFVVPMLQYDKRDGLDLYIEVLIRIIVVNVVRRIRVIQYRSRC